MAITTSNLGFNILGNKNVIIGDVTLSTSAQELVTGLKRVDFFSINGNITIGSGDISVVYNSNDGTKDSKQGSMWIKSGTNNVDGKWMVIGT